MSCEYCTDPDGVPCFPVYGVGPHTHAGRDGNPLLGATIPLPRDEWPENYRESADEPGHGLWWCPHCGDGKPDDLPANDQGKRTGKSASF